MRLLGEDSILRLHWPAMPPLFEAAIDWENIPEWVDLVEVVRAADLDLPGDIQVGVLSRAVLLGELRVPKGTIVVCGHTLPGEPLRLVPARVAAEVSGWEVA